MHEVSLVVAIPYVILALFSIFFGYLASDVFVGMGSDMLSTALFVHPDRVAIVEAHFSLPLYIKNLPVILTLLGAGLAIVLYHRYPTILVAITEKPFGYAVYRFLNSK